MDVTSWREVNESTFSSINVAWVQFPDYMPQDPILKVTSGLNLCWFYTLLSMIFFQLLHFPVSPKPTTNLNFDLICFNVKGCDLVCTSCVISSTLILIQQLSLRLKLSDHYHKTGQMLCPLRPLKAEMLFCDWPDRTTIIFSFILGQANLRTSCKQFASSLNKSGPA